MKRAWVLHGLAVAGWVAGAPAYAAQPDTEMPDDALLEFLGGAESVDGEWLDPLLLADLEAKNKLAEGGRENSADPEEVDEDES